MKELRVLRTCDVPRCTTARTNVQSVGLHLPGRRLITYDLCEEHIAPFVEFVEDVPPVNRRGRARPVVSIEEVLNAKKRATTRR